MKEYFSLSVPDGNYLITEHNIGTIRYGDLIAISAITKALKEQFPRSKFYLNINQYVYDIIDCVAKNFDGYFSNIKRYENLKLLPFSANIWTIYTNLYKNFGIVPNFKIDHIIKDSQVSNKFGDLYQNIQFFKKKYNSKVILFIPLFSTKHNHYNVDRFFPIEFCIDLINFILYEKFTDYFLILAGHEKNYFYKKLKNEIKIIPKNLYVTTTRNMQETIYLMYLSDIYIGGDTGTSHIVANIRKYCNDLIFLYGENSKLRHSEEDKNGKKVCKIKKWCYNDYSPKPIKGKKVLYIDDGFKKKDLIIEKINNFLK